jgi:DNA-binding NarL/FixJ family response regulator
MLKTPAEGATGGGHARAVTRVAVVTSRRELAEACVTACRSLAHVQVEIVIPEPGRLLPGSAGTAGLAVVDLCQLPRAPDDFPADFGPASPPVILVTPSMPLGSLETATRRGVRGIVTERATAAELSRAIDAVLHGEMWLSRRMMSLLLGRVLLKEVGQHVSDFLANAALTEREREVARMTVEGKTNRDIAKALGIETQTVKIHLYHVYQKLRLHSRSELITQATGSYQQTD